MVEQRRIVDLWKRPVLAEDGSGVLVTLVKAEGSTYRRPGARLLTVASSAEVAGTISGGCLEAEVVRRARWIASDCAAVERYETAFDDTAEIPFGLGCGGTLELLFEQASAPEGRALLNALEAALGGRESTVVSFLPGDGRNLRRVIFDSEGTVVFCSPALSSEKVECARSLEPGKVYRGRFVERLEAPQRLFVLGAGDDAKPLVAMAGLLGWSVTVGDGRAHLATRARFPTAERVLHLSSGTEPGIGPKDAVVLMTHSYEQDRDLLIRTLPLAPRYLGLLGSRHRSSLLVAEAAGRLGETVAACCERLFAPVGIDLGGDGPEAIALAIVAEVQAVGHGRPASPRRFDADEVARQIERGGSSLYLQAQCAMDLA